MCMCARVIGEEEERERGRGRGRGRKQKQKDTEKDDKSNNKIRHFCQKKR